MDRPEGRVSVRDLVRGVAWTFLLAVFLVLVAGRHYVLAMAVLVVGGGAELATNDRLPDQPAPRFFQLLFDTTLGVAVFVVLFVAAVVALTAWT